MTVAKLIPSLFIWIHWADVVHSLILPCSQIRTKRGPLPGPLFSSVSDRVDQVLKVVQCNDETAIREAIDGLDALIAGGSDSDNEETLFTPLLGNYRVSFTLPSAPNERPVGGKWSKGPFLTMESQWQHLLPKKIPDSVAQAVNMIIVNVLFWKIYVILRGDAYRLGSLERDRVAAERGTPEGLSPRTVRANFDPPRIVICTRTKKALCCCLSLGPSSSVVLDTTFCDNRVRIGKGSKGSRFVFVRSADPVADEWKNLVELKPVGKRQLMSFFGGVGLASLAGVWYCSGIFRFLSIFTAILSLPLALLILISTGGIEQDRQDSR